MGNKTLDQLFKDIGLVDRWEAEGEARGKAEGEARGEAQKAREIAQNLIKIGLPREQIIATTGLDLPTVEALMETAQA